MATAMAGWPFRHPAERAAVQYVVILPTLDMPLSPAPYRDGERAGALRLVVDDPILRQRQALDVTLRFVNRRWVLNSGIAALFTLSGSAPAVRHHPAKRHR